jgi:ketosteroid isomerase-like protein
MYFRHSLGTPGTRPLSAATSERHMKHSFVAALAIAAMAMGTVGCSERTGPSTPTTKSSAMNSDLAAMRKVIEENNARFTRAHVTGDGPLIDNMFTQDAKVLPPEAEPVVGRSAISKLTSQYIAFGITEFREETTDFYGNEDLLIDQGNYVMVYGKDKTLEKGKYVNVWKKEDGTWKIYSNIWNTNAPPAPAK